MNELQIKFEQGSISTNLAKLKDELQEIASKYEGVVVSEDAVTIAKKDLSELRKLSKEIDDRRKQVKKEWNKPFTEFESEVKSALEILNEPISLIDGQIKEFERQQKADKEQHCRELFESSVGEYAEYIEFSDVFRDTWLNKSTTDNEILSDISGARLKVSTDLEAIKALNSEFENEVIAEYKRTGELSAAIQRNSQLISAKQIAEQKVEQRITEEVKQEITEEIKQEIKKEDKQEAESYAVFTVRTNKEDAEELQAFLDLNGIEYEVSYGRKESI
jgi:hypothetical protein